MHVNREFSALFIFKNPALDLIALPASSLQEANDVLQRLMDLGQLAPPWDYFFSRTPAEWTDQWGRMTAFGITWKMPGDALGRLLANPDDAAKAMTAKDHKPIKIAKPDPCAQYGSRMRVEGMAAKFATGLYVPQMSGAKQDVD